MILQPPPVITEEHVQSRLCNRLLDELISRSDCKQDHLKFFVLRMLSGLPFSASSVNLSRVLQKPVNNKKLIDRLISHGMVVKPTDVQTAVDLLPDGQIDVFKLIVSSCGEVEQHVSECCKTAAKVKKVKMVVCLLERGADPSAVSTDLVCHALERGDRASSEKLWAAMKPTFDPKSVNICSLISSVLADHPDFLRTLLDAGVDPNGTPTDKKKPLTEVVGLSYLTPAKRNALVAILLEKGADCQQLCLTSKTSTTPLHVVTKMALEAGN